MLWFQQSVFSEGAFRLLNFWDKIWRVLEKYVRFYPHNLETRFGTLQKK